MNPAVFLEQVYRIVNLYQAAQKKPRAYRENIVLHAAEVHMLELIGANAGITSSDLAQKLAISKGAVSQTVKKLTDKGLLTRRSSQDGRIAHLSLSKEGHQVFAAHREMHAPMLAGIQKLTAQLTPETEEILQQLIELLEVHLTDITQEEC